MNMSRFSIQFNAHQRRVAWCIYMSYPLHRSVRDSAASRRKGKLLAKTQWFRETKDDQRMGWGESVEESRGKVKADRVSKRNLGRGSSVKEVEPVRTTSVMFVEFSRGGGLQKAVRNCLQSLSPMLGFTFRVAEKGGTPLSSLLSNKYLWSGQDCGRVECLPCKQGGERKEQCMRRNIVYESECEVCNPGDSRREVDRKEGLRDDRVIGFHLCGGDCTFTHGEAKRLLEGWTGW